MNCDVVNQIDIQQLLAKQFPVFRTKTPDACVDLGVDVNSNAAQAFERRGDSSDGRL